MTPEEYLDGDALGTAVLERVRSVLAEMGPVEVRASKSQLAFRRARGFAWLWLPARYLGDRAAGVVVLSIALGRADPSPRFKEVVRASARHWMHHLEIRDPATIDAEVAAWLHEAADRAG